MEPRYHVITYYFKFSNNLNLSSVIEPPVSQVLIGKQEKKQEEYTPPPDWVNSRRHPVVYATVYLPDPTEHVL